MGTRERARQGRARRAVRNRIDRKGSLSFFKGLQVRWLRACPLIFMFLPRPSFRRSFFRLVRLLSPLQCGRSVIMDSHALDPDLQCSICLDFFFEPLTLKCRHSFCRACLLQSTKLAPDGRSCPQCRELIAITDPLTHPADAVIAAKVAEAVPATMIEQRSLQARESLEALARSSASALPVFVMRPGQSEMRPGARISLHF